MKKSFKLVTLILCLFLLPLTGCGNSGDKGGNGDGDKLSYYEEFKFLPMYPDSKKVSYTPPEKEGYMGKGVYSIEEQNVNTAVDKYKSILEKDGWTVDKDESNPFLECKKGDHTAAIVISVKNDVTTIEILAK